MVSLVLPYPLVSHVVFYVDCDLHVSVVVYKLWLEVVKLVMKFECRFKLILTDECVKLLICVYILFCTIVWLNGVVLFLVGFLL